MNRKQSRNIKAQYEDAIKQLLEQVTIHPGLNKVEIRHSLGLTYPDTVLIRTTLAKLKKEGAITATKIGIKNYYRLNNGTQT
jgi:DNA-binding transcriptional regulator PaaX